MIAAILAVGLLFVFGALFGYAIHTHKEILRRQGEERLQHQLRSLEAAEKRQQELLIAVEALLAEKGVPVMLRTPEKRPLIKVPGYFDRKPQPPLTAEEMAGS